MKRPFNVIDLFCGAGGLSYGFESAGFNVLLGIDIDSTALETFEANHNGARSICGDITHLTYENDIKPFIGNKSIDVVIGGPPCQGFSMANRQPLINDPRNNLYKEYLIFLQKARPKVFVMENVKGMLNKMTEILADIKNYLGPEYDVYCDVFNAKNFGVPQNRERLILIGNRIGVSSKQIINDIHGRESTLPRFSLFDAISDLPELLPNRIKNNNRNECAATGYTCVEYSYSNTPFRAFLNGNRSVMFLYNHKNRYNNDRDIEIYSRLPQGANSLHESISDIMPYKSRNGIFKDKYAIFV